MTDTKPVDPAHDLDQIEENVPVDATIPAADDEIAKLKDLLARQMADSQNQAQRYERDKREMGTFFTENFVKKILPTLDNLDRIISGTPESMREGVVYKWVKNASAGLSKTLESLGVTAFESLGKELDPHLHEALTQAPGAEWIVVQEFEKGYMLGDRVVRHAKVIVGNGEIPNS